MGILLRAAFAFAIAYAVYAPHSFAAYFDTPRFAAVKADLAAARPAARLQDMIGKGLEQFQPRREDQAR